AARIFNGDGSLTLLAQYKTLLAQYKTLSAQYKTRSQHNCLFDSGRQQGLPIEPIYYHPIG
ncbi:hypothetical protein, partial [Yersinia pestis]|uniref:hypothetical protein n=1 Tax=Yersinia pestis TaxID=632 RepID=UPI0004A49916